MPAKVNSIAIIIGRIGVVDAAFICFLMNIKKTAKRLFIHITGSLFSDIIQKKHIEEFINAISIVDGVITNKSEVEHLLRQGNTSLIYLPEKELQLYSLERILKTIEVGGTENNLKINKLIGLKELTKRYGFELNQRKLNIGLICGSFDLIHLGHVRLFSTARNLVDVLIVATMSTDAIKQQEKNDRADRPIYSQNDRVTLLSSLRAVDHVVIFEELDCLNLINALKPNYFIKHKKDISRQIVKEECKLVESYEGKVITREEDDVNYSSTNIINYIRSKNN